MSNLIFLKNMILKSNPKIKTIQQHMLSNPKQKTIMSYNIFSLNYIENNLILVYINYII